MSNLFKFTSILLVSLTFTNIFSQIPKKPDQEVTLEEIVVTANKFEQKQSKTGKVITIINKEEILRNIGKTTGELLNQQVGLTIIGSQNNLGSNQEIYMRGAVTGYTLILLNGIPIYDPSNNGNYFDLNLIPIDQIERIEILKGGQSTLYGSDAMAGVINIITNKSFKKPIQFSGNLALGSYKTSKYNLGIGGQIKEKTSYSLQFGKMKSEGFSSAIDTVGNKNYDNDKYLSTNINVLLNHNLSKNLAINGIFSTNKVAADIDESAFNDAKNYVSTSDNKMLGAGGIYSLAKGKIIFNYNKNNSSRAFILDSSKTSKSYINGSYSGKSDFFEVYSNIELNEKIDVLFGLENRQQSMASRYYAKADWGEYTAPELKANQTNTLLQSIYGSFLFKNIGDFGFEIGGRINKHSKFGNNATFTINPYIFIKERVKFFINYSNAFKAPTQYQLFSEYGNTGLKPTTAINIETGVQLFSKNNRSNLRLVYFNRNSKDVIVFESLNIEPYGTYLNYDKQQDYGLEIDGQINIEKITISTNYTYVTGKVFTKTKTFDNLFRRPKNSFNINFTYRFGPKWNTNLSFRKVSQAEPGPFDNQFVQLGKYSVLNVYQVYKIQKDLSLFLDLKNILNKVYFDVPGYSTRKFNFMVGVNFNI